MHVIIHMHISVVYIHVCICSWRIYRCVVPWQGIGVPAGRQYPSIVFWLDLNPGMVCQSNLKLRLNHRHHEWKRSTPWWQKIFSFISFLFPSPLSFSVLRFILREQSSSVYMAGNTDPFRKEQLWGGKKVELHLASRQKQHLKE